MKELYSEQLKAIVGEDNFLCDEPMKKHITFRVGGNADYYVTPNSKEQISELIKWSRENKCPYYIIGNGSNLLVSDSGYRGLIIEIGSKFADVKIEGDVVVAQAGAILARVASLALENSLTGMEFAHGIPGTIGGAVVMNAGAYGGEMKDILVSATVMDSEGNVKILDVSELELSYRHSIVPKNNYIVIEATLHLEKGDASQIKARMDELAKQRRDKQPLEYPSAGSTFKRPEGYFAGKLIEDAGLKGYRCGGAMVSEKHCGFVINYDNATAKDILNVINDVRDRINEDTGISLETEVKIL